MSIVGVEVVYHFLAPFSLGSNFGSNLDQNCVKPRLLPIPAIHVTYLWPPFESWPFYLLL